MSSKLFTKKLMAKRSSLAIAAALMNVMCFFSTKTQAQQEQMQKPVIKLVNKSVSGYVPGRLLVKFKEGLHPTFTKSNGAVHSNITGVENLNQRYSCTSFNRIPTGRKTENSLYIYTLDFPATANVEEMVKAYTQAGVFEAVEPDYYQGITTTTPNDPYFTYSWGMYNNGSFAYAAVSAISGRDMDMKLAWDLTQGSSSVTVAIIDAGLKLDHPEFTGRIWSNTGEIASNGVDDDGNGLIDDTQGWDWVNNDNNPTDDNGHGTNVTGIIGAKGNNGIGYAGIDWNCKLMALKTQGSTGSGSSSSAIAAIYYATNEGAKVINMSIGGPGYSSVYQGAINHAYANGVTVVASMGNDNTSTASYPAAYNHVIAVGASRCNDTRATFSNYGSHISVIAPGDVIFGLSHTSNTDYTSGMSGTSQAAPHVTGLVSLMLALDASKTPDQIKAIIENTAEDMVGSSSEDVAGFDNYYGHGRVNAYQALLYCTTPNAITGTTSFCVGGTSTLASSTTGGAWSSSNTSIATVNSSTGVVTGVAAGQATITYKKLECYRTATVTIKPTPSSVSISPTSSTVCLGSGTSFTASATAGSVTLLSEDWNSGYMNGWTTTSNNSSGFPQWTLRSSGGYTGSMTGDGTNLMESVPGASSSNTTTTLVSPSFSTSGYASATLTYNQYYGYVSTADVTAQVEYSTNGGSTWTVLYTQLGSSNTATSWSAASPTKTISLPSGALNVSSLKLRWNYNSTTGNIWALDNIAVKGSTAVTYAWSGPSGISCSTCSNPTITPTSAGSNTYTVSATANSCSTTNTATMTVNSGPAAIGGGTSAICAGATTTLTNSVSGGTWSSAGTSIATVGSSNGVVTGVATGTAVISYTTSCGSVTKIVSVNASPAAIGGTATVCTSATTTLTNTTSGGTWSSAGTSIATVGSTSGVVTGVATGTATISYTTGCGSATKIVTVSSAPAVISGSATLCSGSTSLYTNTVSGGTWSSSNTAVGTIGSSSGTVTGIAAGNTTISYVTGCGLTTKAITVNATPASITGTATLCVSATTTLANTATGGVWTSASTSIATVGSSNGVVTGVASGTAVISYTTSCGTVTKTVTVSSSPAAIGGAGTVCISSSITLTNSVSGGSWTSANPTIATVGSSTGVVTGGSTGTVTISYTTSCGTTTAVVTVSTTSSAGSITGTASVCAGSNTTLANTAGGGVWSSTNTGVATIGSSNGVVAGITAGTATISYTITSGCGTTAATKIVTVNSLPAAITGTASVCAGSTTSLSSATTGGTWTSANTGVATITTGGVVTGVTANTTTISYSLSTGCAQSTVVTVNALPSAITGTTTLCVFAQVTLSSATTGGTWTSGITPIATINSTTGVLMGMASGVAPISYTLPTGCRATTSVTVNALPASIAGSTSACAGNIATLTNTTTGGTWSSSTTGVATITSSGVVTSVAAGTTTISYTLSTGCRSTTVFTVNAAPSAGSIVGTAAASIGYSTTLSSTASGGTWSSSNTSVATIGSATGIVTGVATGTSTISYTVTNTCGSANATTIVTINTVTAASGLNFDGSNDHIAVGTDVTQLGQGDFTIEAWVKTTGTSMSIVTCMNSNTSWEMGEKAFYIDGSGMPWFVGWGNEYIRSTQAVNDGAWHHVAVTWDYSGSGVSGSGKMYVDGTDRTGFVSYNAYYNNTGTFYVGRSNFNGGEGPNYFNGSLDEVRIWNRALCQSEITNNMNCQLTGGETGLKAYYKLNQGNVGEDNTSVTTATDASVSGYNGTLTNFALTGSTSNWAAGNVSGSCATFSLISGTASTCVGSTTTLTSATSGGSWSSSNTSVGTVNSSTGVVTGLTVGTTTVSYTTGSCNGSIVVTVNTAPTAGTISGSSSVCQAAATTLTSTVSGGTWSSSSTSVATVGSSSGIVSGVASGSATITYSVSSSCGLVTATTSISVNPLPIIGFVTTVPSTLCAGSEVSLGSGSTSFLNSPVASGSTYVCDCPPGYVAVGYNGRIGSWMDQFKLACVKYSGGALSGTTVFTSSNGISVGGGAYGPYYLSGTGILVGLQGYGSYISGAYAGITGYGQSASYIEAGGSNSSAPTVLTSILAGSNYSLGTVYVPDGNVVTGMYSYDNYHATGVALRYKPISSFSAPITSIAWSSSDTFIAKVTSSGVVTGIGAGSVVITYSATNSCGTVDSFANITITTTPSVAAITGSSSVCVGASTTFADSTSGGTWSSSDTSIASVNTSGIVTGVAAGSALISYTVSNSCGPTVVTKFISVNSLADAGTISGSSNVCVSSTLSLSATVSGGVWSSSNVGHATVNTSGVVTGVGAGTANITYAVSGGCGSASTTKTVTVNTAPSAGTISGASSVTAGSSITLTASVTGGVWSAADSILTVSSAGVVTGLTPGTSTVSYSVTNVCGTATATKSITVGVAVPGITGELSVCIGSTTTLSNSMSGGTWTAGNTKATVSSVGVVTGVTAGTVNITYNVSGSISFVTVTVNPLPGAITGTMSACAGGTMVLSSTSPGGSWSSATPSVATVDASTGAVSAMSGGAASITYTLPTGCTATAVVTVNAIPASITGTGSMCVGMTTSLSSTTTGGTWSSSLPGVANISTSGVVTGMSAGTATITYTAPGGCKTTTIVTVNVVPGAIAGTAVICQGFTTALSNTTTGGSWSSSNTTVATVDLATGLVTGVSGGTAVISYITTAGCYVTKAITVNPTPSSITGTLTVCVGVTTSLSSATGGAVSWTSSNTAVATVNSGTGVVTGVSAGMATITYTVGTGCKTTAVVTVNALPAAITGTMSVCVGGASILSSTTTGGTWSSSLSTVASIDSTGTVTGNAAGNAIITYSLGAGCNRTAAFTVNPLPSSITGTASACVGATTNLSTTSSGGTWSSGTPAVATVGATGLITGIAAGTSEITYTLPTGCQTTRAVTILAAPAPITGTLSVCTGATTSLSSTTTGGTWSSSNTTKATVDSTGFVTTLTSGTVTITYTAGCKTTAVLTINVLPGAITGTMSACLGGTMALSNSVSGGAWSTGDTTIATINASTGVVSTVGTGTTSVTYTLSTGCSTTTTITVNSAPASITGTTTVCTGLTTTLSNTATGGAWNSSNPSVANISSTGVVTGMSAGTATITYTLPGGCKTTTGVVVNASPVAIGGTATMCEGFTTTLTNATSGGVWTSGSTSIATVDVSTGVVIGLSAGTAVISYTTSLGCYSTKVVTVNPLPADITGTLSLCPGGTTTLASATGTGVSWVSSTTSVATVNTATGVVTGVAVGTTTITYTIGTGCKTFAEVTVNAAPPAITGTLSVCVGGMTSLSNTSTGGTWSSSATTVASIDVTSGVATGNASGTAIITYSVGAGCNRTATLTVNALPAAIGGTGVACVGATTVLTNTTSGGTWSNSSSTVATVGSASGVVTGISAGTSEITYTLSTGCMATKIVTINTAPASITGTLNVCVGSTILLSNATSGGTWSSSNARATVDSTGLVTGVSSGTVTITYNAGCATTAVVTVNALPSAITGTMSACAGNSLTLSTTTTGGAWSSSDTTVATIDATTGVVTTIASGNTTITYTSAAGCTATAIVTVTSAPAGITGSTTACVGSTTALSSTTGGGTWSSSTPSIANVSSIGVVTGMAAGTATITYTVSGGCKTTLIVTIYSVPAAITGTATMCELLSTTLSDATSGGEWLSGDITVATVGSTTGIVTGVSGGTAAITYSTGTGCYSTKIVTVNPAPAAITGTLVLCPGSTSTLASATGTPVSWTSSTPSVATINSGTAVVTGVAAGTTRITYTIGSGCITTAVVTVNAIPTSITGPNKVCIGSNITLANTVSGGVWTSSNANVSVDGSTGVVTGVTAGTTIITYTTGSGCYKTYALTINTNPNPSGGYKIACVGLTTQLTNVSGGAWSSSDTFTAKTTVGGTNAVVTGVAPGTANITFTLSTTGCYNVSVVTVNAVPPAITGSGLLCVSSATTLANATPGGTWSSSNTAIANVGSTGVVTSGTLANVATISYNFGANCRVTTVVTVRQVPAVITGPATVCAGTTVTYTNSTGNGTWSSSNTLAATVVTGASSFYGAVTGVAPGVTTLTYTNAPSCIRTLNITVGACRGVNSTTGIDNASNGIDVSVYPNPTTGAFAVEAHVAGTLQVYTMDGRELTKYPVVKGTTQLSLPQETAKGIYMCRFNGEDGSTVMVRLILE